MKKDIETLMNNGYRVVEKNAQNSHYHVFFGTTFINLWANAKKFMPQQSQPATEYEDIQEVIEYMQQRTYDKDVIMNKLRGNK